MVDSRHKHLLEPIRDLATNWNIDLASELEDYLHELESVTISFDDGESINFVEAALLIQGSACVYSKKVEYLYNLLYKCLEVVTEKKKTKEKNSVAAEGIDSDAIFNDLPYLLPLDEYLIDGKTIDLDDSKGFNYDKMRALTMICRPPMGALDRVDEGKQQFRVSDCVIHMSGALLFRAKDGVLLDASLERIKTMNPLAELPFGSPQAVMMMDKPSETRPPITPMDSVPEGTGEPAEDFPEFDAKMSLEGEDEDDDDTTDRKHVDPIEDVKEFKSNEFDPLGTQLAEEVDEDAPPDPWQLEDPHEAPRTKPKPFRKVVPKAPRHTITPSSSGNSFLRGLYADPAEESVRKASEKNSMRAPYWPQFASLFVNRVHTIQKAKKEQSLREKEQRARVSGLVQMQLPPVAQQQQEEGDPFSDDDEDISPVFEVEQAEEVNEWEEPVPENTMSTPLETMDELAALTRTYEDVCREHVDANMSKATKFLNESQISKRVAEWQAKLEPTFAAEELRPTFDIHQYGRNLMDIMMTKNGPQPPKDLSSVRLDFHAAVEGKPRYDVCRYFLAALQLANNHNVVISPSQVHFEETKEDIPSMKLQLLSLERVEVNIEGGETVPSSKKSRGKKKKGVAEEAESKTNGDDDSKYELELEESEYKSPPGKSPSKPKISQSSEEKQTTKLKKRGR